MIPFALNTVFCVVVVGSFSVSIVGAIFIIFGLNNRGLEFYIPKLGRTTALFYLIGVTSIIPEELSSLEASYSDVDLIGWLESNSLYILIVLGCEFYCDSIVRIRRW